MPPQAPIPAEFRALTFEYEPSSDGCNGNLLLLLHGLAIANGSSHRLKGIIDTRRRLSLLLRYLCCDKGWDPARLFLLGYAQGGSMALDTAICGDWPLALNPSATSLGGVVSISGPPLDEMVQAGTSVSSPDFRLNQVAAQMPILLTHGADDNAVPLSEARAKYTALSTRLHLRLAEFYMIPRKQQTMPNSAEELQKILGFFAERMVLRDLALERDPSVIEVERFGQP
ncbi:hypothetical protein H4R34_004012 [Dimargaris verticillata]|uniref:Phospholipase/carboxylesterase/thioesterase domain-containing protein n=1 Tax=Dimargaris verticillata TaxID=2761393 RepID=A0A9W8E7N2_9FUNG|nr:hypothetical protein H4R34_004012 [Dimargaris verticillata]